MNGKDHVQVLRGMRVNKHVNKLRLKYQKAIKRQGADFFMLTADYSHKIALFLSQPRRECQEQITRESATLVTMGRIRRGEYIFMT